jgi:hypothetical protein
MPRGVARSAADRDRALAILERDGLAAASQQTGIPKGTILGWTSSNVVRTSNRQRVAAAVEERVVTMAERRTRLAERLLTVAEQRVELLGESPKADSRHLAVVAAIAIEKSQLLAGEATVRTEAIQPEQARSELADLQRHWRERRLTA